MNPKFFLHKKIAAWLLVGLMGLLLSCNDKNKGSGVDTSLERPEAFESESEEEFAPSGSIPKGSPDGIPSIQGEEGKPERISDPDANGWVGAGEAAQPLEEQKKKSPEEIAALKKQFSYLPEQKFIPPTEEDFGVNPDLGIVTSKRAILVTLKEGTSAEQFQKIVSATGCVLGGTIPIGGIFQLDCGTSATFETINRILEQLRARPEVLVAILDKKFESPRLYPPEPAGDQSYRPQFIDAPAAWNLNQTIEQRQAETPHNPWPIPVAVFDAGFYDHPDLQDILTLGPGNTYCDASQPADEYCNHGTGIAGIIGANLKNGRFTQGTSPFVQIVGMKDELSLTLTAQNLQDVLRMNPRPRIINTELTYYWSIGCINRGNLNLNNNPNVVGAQRCDPRSNGRIPDGNACTNSAAIQADIANDGRFFARLVQTANLLNETLFVCAAGNDSGPMLNPGEDYCRDCQGPGGCPKSGMGHFPADLAAPCAWAAIHAPFAEPHIIVVEAAIRLESASFSNVNGGGVAANTGGRAPSLDSSNRWGTRTFGGTSAATPHVAGVATFLLAAEPTLTDEELKMLITKRPFARPIETWGASTTETQVSLYGALLGICQLPRFAGRCHILKGLADMNYSTSNGGTVAEFNPDGICANEQNPTLELDGKIDMKDFRFLRNQSIMFENNQFLLNPCTHTRLPMDLNLDGVEETRPIDEGDARADLNNDFFVGSVRHPVPLGRNLVGNPAYESLTDLEVFQKVYEGDSVQQWAKEELPELLGSADLHILPRQVWYKIGAPRVEMTIKGRGPLLTLDTTKLENKQFRTITPEFVLTTPLPIGVEVTWQAICEDGRRMGNPVVVAVGDLEAGEARAVKLEVGESCPERCDDYVNPACVAAPPPPPPPPPPRSETWTRITTNEQTTRTSNNVTITTSESRKEIRNPRSNQNGNDGTWGNKGRWSLTIERCVQGCDRDITNPEYCGEGCRITLTETDCNAGTVKVTTSRRENRESTDVTEEGTRESSVTAYSECPVRTFLEHNGSSAPQCHSSGTLLQNDGSVYSWTLGNLSGSYQCIGCGAESTNHCRCVQSGSQYFLECNHGP